MNYIYFIYFYSYYFDIFVVTDAADGSSTHPLFEDDTNDNKTVIIININNNINNRMNPSFRTGDECITVGGVTSDTRGLFGIAKSLS